MRFCKVLVVEDEDDISIYLSKILTKLGHSVIKSVKSANEAIEFFEKEDVDLVFMDININGSIDGIQLSRILNIKKRVAVIFTTGYSDDEVIQEAISTFTYGYVVKPFDEKDIRIAINIAIERLQNDVVSEVASNKIEHLIKLSKNYSFDYKNQMLFKDNEIIKLTKKEARVLSILCKNTNHIVSFESLHQNIWKNKTINASTIRCIVSSIRSKLDDVKIETVYGMGYILRG